MTSKGCGILWTATDVKQNTEPDDNRGGDFWELFCQVSLLFVCCLQEKAYLDVLSGAAAREQQRLMYERYAKGPIQKSMNMPLRLSFFRERGTAETYRRIYVSRWRNPRRRRTSAGKVKFIYSDSETHQPIHLGGKAVTPTVFCRKITFHWTWVPGWNLDNHAFRMLATHFVNIDQRL